MRTVTSIEDLDRNILTLCTRINAATYELLVLICEFEERGGHLKWGLGSCAEWLAWRCDLSMTTAFEKVRVARALKTSWWPSPCGTRQRTSRTAAAN